MPHVIRVDTFGGPDVMQWVEVPQPTPGEGQVGIRQTAIGVNFLDVYHRAGLYPLDLPMTPGSEGVGIVDTVGSGVTGLKAGDRVAYMNVVGGYAEYRLVPAGRLLRLPDPLDARTAAGGAPHGLA